MSEINAKIVSQLRARTGAGLMDCKKALVETKGNIEEAITVLKKKGIASAAKKSGREATEGIVHSYIHFGGKLGVLIEVNCETDFVARNDDFKAFVNDICMHIAAASPMYVTKEDVPAELVAKEKEIAESQCAGKPPAAIEKIVAGKLDKWYAQTCLLAQPYVKNNEQTIQAFLKETISKVGENIVIKRFSRYQIGE